ncbi:MAG: hypothetical protein QNJ46_19815 [Leptolyngbyaceae cyanobacterium MO_188.B28]|nr:hypothetical protein [Leptolyngbyaceae cyanobacterium MO_188.B28]
MKKVEELKFMADSIDVEIGELPPDLGEIAARVKVAAVNRRHDTLALLALLRLLEYLHREIRDVAFYEALPNSRQTLYSLLRDIEVNGGWPYIQRMKLRSLLDHLELLEPESE